MASGGGSVWAAEGYSLGFEFGEGAAGVFADYSAFEFCDCGHYGEH